MKKLIIALVLSIAGYAASAEGINFTSGTWNSVMQQAAKEKKLVYVDVYTTWCGPCKLLVKNIFPNKEVGEYYNRNFVNYRIDAEKGEGQTVAAKYEVSGYPTHLFIDPKTQKIVYRSSGYSADIKHFIQEGSIALQERKDPMTLEKYEKDFAKGKRKISFLKDYLIKTKRLGVPNDAVLNAYVAELGNKRTEKDIEFLSANTNGINNNAFPLLADAWAKLPAEEKEKKSNQMESWLYKSFAAAAEQEDEKLLNDVFKNYVMYFPEKSEGIIMMLTTEYYSKTGNEAKAWEASKSEAMYLTNKSDDSYFKEDSKELQENIEMIKSQLKEANVPEDKMDELVQSNLDKNPSMRKSASIHAANRLNGVAWSVYVKSNKSGELTEMKEALPWAAKAMKLSENDTQIWTAAGDTYAQLLYATGNKAKAITVQQDVVKKATDLHLESEGELNNTLIQMQEGTL